MEHVLLKRLQEMQNNLNLVKRKELYFENDVSKLINISKYKLPLKIRIKSNARVDLLLCDFLNENDIEVVLEDNAFLNLKIITNDIEKTIILHENLAKSSSFSCFFADFSNSSITFKNSANIEDGAEFNFYTSCLSYDLNKKNFDISCTHVRPFTTSNIQFFGVAIQSGSIEMKGFSVIEEKCIKSNANQNAKIILFDKESRGVGSPTLRIDCDDVKASHGCAIGSLNEEHIFYLKSRGLTTNEARKLITLGYLEPIKQYFTSKEAKIIDNAIKEGFNFD